MQGELLGCVAQLLSIRSKLNFSNQKLIVNALKFSVLTTVAWKRFEKKGIFRVRNSQMFLQKFNFFCQTETEILRGRVLFRDQGLG